MDFKPISHPFFRSSHDKMSLGEPSLDSMDATAAECSVDQLPSPRGEYTKDGLKELLLIQGLPHLPADS